MKYFFCLLSVMLPLTLFAEINADSAWVVTHYTKRDVTIPMRDGIKLYTVIYEPKDTKELHPILMERTPYSVAPYGNDTFADVWESYEMAYFKENYIIVEQDVRGCMMSEGV